MTLCGSARGSRGVSGRRAAAPLAALHRLLDHAVLIMRASVRPPHLAQLGQIGAERKGRQVGPVGRAAPGHRQAHPPRPARSGRRMRSASPARHRPWPPARPGQRSPGRRQGRKCRSWPAAVPGDGSRSSAASPTRGSRVAGGAHSPLPAAGGLDQPRPPVASQWQAVAAGAPQWQPAAIDVPCTKCPPGPSRCDTSPSGPERRGGSTAPAAGHPTGPKTFTRPAGAGRWPVPWR